MKMKYIVVEIDGKHVPIIFGEALSHKGMLQGVREALRQSARESRNPNASWSVEPVSAGFVEGLHADNVAGYSESMRYGQGYIDNHDLTVAHPATDLPLINGNAKPRVSTADRDMLEAAEDVRSHGLRKDLFNILRGVTSESRHKSYNKRKVIATQFVKTHMLPEASDGEIHGYMRGLVKEYEAGLAPNEAR